MFISLSLKQDVHQWRHLTQRRWWHTCWVQKGRKRAWLSLGRASSSLNIERLGSLWQSTGKELPQSSITQHPPCQLYPLSSHFCLSHLFSACNNNNNNNDTTAQQVIGRIEQFRCNNVVVILTKCYIFGRPAWPPSSSFLPWGTDDVLFNNCWGFNDTV